MALLISDDFAGSAISGDWTGAGVSFFTNSHYSPNTAAAKFVTSPAAPLGGECLHYYIMSGTDETVPCRLQKDTAYTERYLEFRMYFASNFFYPGGLKIARFGVNAGGGSTAFFEYNYDSGDPRIVFYSYNHVNDTEWTTYYPYVFAESTWYKIGLHFRESTPSTADGFYKLYINDILVRDSGNIITRTNSTQKDFVWLGGNHSWSNLVGEGGGATASGNSSLYYANVRLHDSFPSGTNWSNAVDVIPFRSSSSASNLSTNITVPTVKNANYRPRFSSNKANTTSSVIDDNAEPITPFRTRN